MDTTPCEFAGPLKQENDKIEKDKKEKLSIEDDKTHLGILESAILRRKKRRGKRFREFIERNKERRAKKKTLSVSCLFSKEQSDGAHHTMVRHEAKINLVEESTRRVDEVEKSLGELKLDSVEHFPPLSLTRSVGVLPDLTWFNERRDRLEREWQEATAHVKYETTAAGNIEMLQRRLREEEERMKLEEPPPLERNSPSFGRLQVEPEDLDDGMSSLDENEKKAVIQARETVDSMMPGCLAVDSVIAMLMVSAPIFSETGVSDVVLFAREMMCCDGDFSRVRYACLTFANTLQARYGSHLLKDNARYLYTLLVGWVDEFIKPLKEHLYVPNWATMQVSGEEGGPEEASFTEYVDVVTKKLQSYLSADGFSGAFPELPSWNTDWTKDFSNFKHSSLFYSMMELLKNATALFALLTFLDKDKAKEVLETFNTKAWFKSIKLVGASTLTFMAILAIVKEVAAIRARHAVGEPLFGTDELLSFHEELNDLIESSDTIPKDYMMSDDGRSIACTKNSMRVEEVGVKIRDYSCKHALTMRPDERANLVSLDKKLILARKLTLESFQAVNKRRTQPYAITFVGEPGIGKTLLVGVIHELAGMLLGLPTGNDYMYVKNFYSKYDDTFRYYMWHATFDDFGQVKPDMVQQFAASIFGPIAYINSTENPAVKAVAEEKGKAYIHPKLVTLTANKLRESIKAVVMDEFAILRRLGPIVYPVLRDPFRSPTDNKQLDYGKYAECMASGQWPEGYPWDFQIGKYYVGTDDVIKMKYVDNPHSEFYFVERDGETVTQDVTLFSFQQFLYYFKTELKNHRRQSEISFSLSMDRCAKCGEPLVGHLAFCDKDTDVLSFGYVQTGQSSSNLLSEEFTKRLLDGTKLSVKSIREKIRAQRVATGWSLYDRIGFYYDKTGLGDLGKTCKDRVLSPFRSKLFQLWRADDFTTLSRDTELLVADKITLLTTAVVLGFVLMCRQQFTGMAVVSTAVIYGLVFLLLLGNWTYIMLAIIVMLIHMLICLLLQFSTHYSEKQLLGFQRMLLDILTFGKINKSTLWRGAKLLSPIDGDIVEGLLKACGLAAGVFMAQKFIGYIINDRKKSGLQVSSAEKYPDFSREEPKEVKEIQEKYPAQFDRLLETSRFYEKKESEEGKSKRNDKWKNLQLASAISTAAYFAVKSRFPEASLKEMLMTMTFVAKLSRLDGTGPVPIDFSAVRYREVVFLPRHGVEYWRSLGLFSSKDGYAWLTLLSSVPGFNRPNIRMQVKFDDFEFDEFDFCCVKVSQEWGPQAQKLDKLFWDVEEDFRPNLVGLKGFIYAPCRNDIVEVKFRHSADYAVIMSPMYNGVMFKTYENKRNVQVIDYECTSVSTRNGDCHSPVVAIDQQGRASIVGFHTQSWLCSRTQVQVQGAYVVSTKMLDRLNDRCVAKAKSLSIPVLPKTRVEIAGPMHMKSILNTRQIDSDVQVIGTSVDKVRPTAASQFQNTKIHDRYIAKLEAAGGIYGAPEMKAKVNQEGKWTDPFEKPLKAFDVKEGVKPFPMHIFRQAAEDYLEDLTIGLSIYKEEIERVRAQLDPWPEGHVGVLTLNDAINGVADGSKIPAINLKTSAGSEFPGGKMAWLDLDDAESAKRGRPCYKLKLEAQEAFDQAWVNCRDALDFGVTYTSQLKDEVRVKGKDARVFYMMQFIDMLRHRMVFAFAQFVLRLNRRYSENYIGLNCASSDWEVLYTRLVTMSFTGTDKDFKEYDMKQKRPMRLYILQIVWEGIAKLAGYNTLDMHMMRNAGIEDSFAYTWCQGEVFLSPGNNNSGSVKTSDDNCIMNSVFHRCVWISVVAEEDARGILSIFFSKKKRKYRDFCALACFGDDSNEAIAVEVQSFYNFKVFKDWFAQYGIVVTPAKKEEGDYTVKPMADCEFLKRGFKQGVVKDSEGKDVYLTLAPLALSSLYKPLCHQIASKVVTSEVQTIGAIQSINRELWMHGRELFDSEHEGLVTSLGELGYFGHLETFDEITKLYLEDAYSTDYT